MNNTWFRRLLISYIPVFFIVTAILFFLFFQAFSEQNRKEALKANEFLASQVVQYVDNSLRSIDYKVLRELLTNPDIKEYFSSFGSDDVYAAIKAVGVIDELKIDFPLIDSIYLVRFHDGTVLSNGKQTPIDAFADAAFIQESRKNPPQSWTGAREFKAFVTEPGARVISLVRIVPNDGDGLMVINIDLESLQKSIGRMYDSSITFVNLFDLSGTDLLENNDIKNIDSESSGIFSKFTSGYTRWKVQTGLRNGKLFKWALDFYNVWFAVAIAVILLGVIWIFYITRRNYKPIQQIVMLIQTFSSQNNPISGRPDKNEFKFIQTNLERMIEETKQYQQQYEDNLILQKKYFFQELLEGNRRIEEDEWISEISKFNLPSDGKQWIVIIVEIDRYRRFTQQYDPQSQSLLKFVLSSVLEETAEEGGMKVWAEWISDRRLSCMLWLPDSPDREKIGEDMMKTYLERVGQYLRFTVTIGVGQAAADLLTLRLSYQDAVHSLQYKAVMGTARFIRRQDVPDVGNDVYQHLKALSKFLQSMRLSEEEWKRHLESLFEQIAHSRLSRQEIVNIMQFMVKQYELEFAELSREYQELWTESMERLAVQMDEWETLEDLRQHCLELFGNLAERIQAIRNAKGHRSLILEIRKYIEENYANPELSLNYLSDLFNINGKYLSKLFKDELGDKFLDFLISHRIENAKQLMMTTDKPIQEISEQVGYTNYISFNRAFKNVVGVAPSDFRKQMTGTAN